MKTLMILSASALGALTLAACSQPAEQSATPETSVANTVAVTDVWCRATPNAAKVAGCYATLTSEQADRLVSVSSPASDTVEIHEMKTEKGVMSMSALPDGLPLPAGQAAELKPGSTHLMLIGLKEPLKAGDSVALTLKFENAADFGAHAEVRSIADSGVHGGH